MMYDSDFQIASSHHNIEKFGVKIIKKTINVFCQIIIIACNIGELLL